MYFASLRYLVDKNENIKKTPEPKVKRKSKSNDPIPK